jgi:hypothetical protein
MMLRWHDEDKRRLERDLIACREERGAISAQLQRITEDLRDAWRELEMYKREPRSDARRQANDGRKPRSRSLVENRETKTDSIE